MKTIEATNIAIADALEQLADRLAEREANPHRVQAYQTAAQTLRHLEQPVTNILQEKGIDGLKVLPGIGDSLASRIAGFVETGRLLLLEQIRSDFSPRLFFSRVPGIGAELAQRIHEELGIETLEALEVAAHDGRLAQIEGFGQRRIRALRDQLQTMLSRQSSRRARRFQRVMGVQRVVNSDEPLVAMLLSVDREYRHRSSRQELQKIAPRRFNPSGEAWLPILNTLRRPWRFTALFSNSARAHELNKTDDWIVIYGEREGLECQYTVVTETRGDMKGLRVVRGREAECRAYYQKRQVRAA